MARGRRWRSLFQPGRTTEKLHRHGVTGIHAFDFGGNIDQAVGLDHGGEDPGSLITGGPDLKHAPFTP